MTRGTFLCLLTIQLDVVVSGGGSSFDVEPKCSKYDFEEKLLEKMVRNEHATGLMKDQLNELHVEFLKMKEKIAQLKSETREDQSKLMDLIQELRWDEWGPWGSCAASCSGGVGERLQSRTRYRKVAVGTDAPAQTESRPCNSVQFASCKHPNNTDQFFAVSYGFENTLAQATCTAIASGGYVNAVRRTCSGSAPDCAAVCTSVGRKCFNSLHVYSGSPPTQLDTAGQKVLQMYKYNACGGGCGPNFCCCKN